MQRAFQTTHPSWGLCRERVRSDVSVPFDAPSEFAVHMKETIQLTNEQAGYHVAQFECPIRSEERIKRTAHQHKIEGKERRCRPHR